MYDVVVVGGGQAGLAAGYHLKRAGLEFTILEASDQPVGSWPHYYDSLKLFSPARYSSLPGLPFPGDPERYPLRDEVIAYLRNYAAHFSLPIITHARVQDVTQQDGLFHLTTTEGDRYQARGIIAATGAFNHPHLPQFPEQATFRGEILHSAHYCQPEPFRGKRVVVVGGGNSAVQIAVELARGATVTLASRHPIRFRRQRILGRDIHFWLKVTGLDIWPLPKQTTVSSPPAVLDMGQYRAALEAGRPDNRPLFTSFTPGGVIWSDGKQEHIDSVLFATGYEPNVDFLTNVGVVGTDRQPLQKAGIGSVPGLYFMGLSGQRSFSSATLRGVGRDAKHVVDHLVRYLHATHSLSAN